MQQRQPRYSLMRRILFPYSGEEALTRKQGLRVILTWSLLFPLFMTFCTWSVAILGARSWQFTLLLVSIALLSGVAVFGTLGWLVVSMNNRSARIRRERNAATTTSTSGGRYGSSR